MSTRVGQQSSARDERHASLDSSHDKSMNTFTPQTGSGDHYVQSVTPSYSHGVPDFDFGGHQSLDQSVGNTDQSFPPTASANVTYDSLDVTRELDHFSLQQHNYLHPPINAGTASSSVGQGLSPTSNAVQDQISPSSFMSDPMYQDFGPFDTTEFDQQLLNQQLGEILNLGDSVNNIPFDTAYTTGGDPFNSLHPQGVPVLNGTQAPPPSVRSGSQLLSPSLTQSSSPVIDDSNQIASKNQTRQRGGSFGSRLSPVSAADMTGSGHLHGKVDDQSPGVSSSPGGVPLASSMSFPSHLTSPIVRVENYSRGESPVRPDMTRRLSKRSQGSKRSATHLSPYAAEESSSDDGGTALGYGRESANVQTGVQRDDDGSWVLSHEVGQGGLNPAQRGMINDATTLSVDDLEKRRMVAEKNDEVASWLEHSDVGSDAGDYGDSLRPPRRNRRRARSFNDMTSRRPGGGSLGLGLQANIFDDSGIPGPGVYIDERSEYDYDYEDDDMSGSLQSSRPPSPPAQVDMNLAPDGESYFPNLPQSISPQDTSFTKPWQDPPLSESPTEMRYQPDTSNAAIMRFRRRAKDIESASLAATIGSRKNLSETDLSSLFQAPGISRNLGDGLVKTKSKDKSKERRGSFLNNIRIKRSNSNVLKRKQSHPLASPQPHPIDTGPFNRKESLGNRRESQDEDPDHPRRSSSWKRITRTDTNLSIGSRDSGSGTKSPGPSRPFSNVVNTIKRARSRSDLGKPKMGLTELMTQHGGPPMLTLATTPMSEAEPTKANPVLASARDDEEISPDEDLSAAEAVVMDLKVRSDPIIPTAEGFRTHARQLNPRLVDYMVERITQEQMRRYKRLLEFKVKHVSAVKNKNCSSTKFCLALGGESKPLPPRVGNKDSETPFIGFQVTAPGSDEEEAEAASEGTVVAAQFPPGVPLPPVKRLPAEFECPLCFKVKKFYKPSDWTKHVHEDVQPFTCTFPNCGEPKSFKRKADWVRHENERHRQLENWTCNIGDCTHQCFRKDNFVQHLVREHKIPEPRTRTVRSANSARDDGPVQWQGAFAPQPGNDGTEDIWSIVERCRRDTTKQPKDEPCRFCGNICNSWKKLTVHLAKHMEQISMPVLPLVEQKHVQADTIISPIEVPHQEQLITPSKSPIDRAQQIKQHSPVPPSNFNPQYNQTYPTPYAHNILPSNVAAPTMHTYPPPMVGYRAAPSPQPAVFDYNSELPTTFDMRSYPGMIDVPERAQARNGPRVPSQNHNRPSVNTQNNPSRYIPPITPDSAFSHHQMFTSPVDTSGFSGNVGDMQAQYLTTNTQQGAGEPDQHFEFDQNSAMQYQQQNQFMSNQYMPNQSSGQGQNQFNY